MGWKYFEVINKKMASAMHSMIYLLVHCIIHTEHMVPGTRYMLYLL